MTNEIAAHQLKSNKEHCGARYKKTSFWENASTISRDRRKTEKRWPRYSWWSCSALWRLRLALPQVSMQQRVPVCHMFVYMHVAGRWQLQTRLCNTRGSNMQGLHDMYAACMHFFPFIQILMHDRKSCICIAILPALLLTLTSHTHTSR